MTARWQGKIASRASPAAAVSFTREAFCCVTSSIGPTVLLTCSILTACFRLDAHAARRQRPACPGYGIDRSSEPPYNAQARSRGVAYLYGHDAEQCTDQRT